MLIRIIFSALLFYFAIFSPSIFFILLGFLSVLLFDDFYEFLIFSFVVDILYGFPVEGLYGFRFIFFSIALIVFVVGKLIRRKVRFFETV